MTRPIPAVAAAACLALAAALAPAVHAAGLWEELRPHLAGIAAAGPVLAGLLRVVR